MYTPCLHVVTFCAHHHIPLDLTPPPSVCSGYCPTVWDAKDTRRTSTVAALSMVLHQFPFELIMSLLSDSGRYFLLNGHQRAQIQDAVVSNAVTNVPVLLCLSSALMLRCRPGYKLHGYKTYSTVPAHKSQDSLFWCCTAFVFTSRQCEHFHSNVRPNSIMIRFFSLWLHTQSIQL